MSNSRIDHCFAPNYSTINDLCFCGEHCYPRSIWEPILKITTNGQTMAAQTWEYHSRCVADFLNSTSEDTCEGFNDPSKDRRNHLKIITLKRARHCVLTGEKIPPGKRVVLFQNRTKKECLTTPERVKELLASTPLPVACSSDRIIIDWITRCNNKDPQEVRAKYDSRLKKTKGKTFDTEALQIIETVEKLEREATIIKNDLERSSFDFIRTFLRESRNSRYYTLSPQIIKGVPFVEEISVRELWAETLLVIIDFENKLLNSMSKTNFAKYKRFLSILKEHGFSFLGTKDFSFDGTVIDKIGDFTLKIERSFYKDDTEDRKKFLELAVKLQDDFSLTSEDFAEYFVGESSIVKQLCLHLRREFFHE